MDEIRVGRISAINYKAGTARIVYEDRDRLTTLELPFLSYEYKMPNIGDMVLVLHLSNGTEMGVVMGSFWNSENIPKESGEGIYRKDFGRNNECYVKYDDNTKKMEVHNEGPIEVYFKNQCYVTYDEENKNLKIYNEGPIDVYYKERYETHKLG